MKATAFTAAQAAFAASTTPGRILGVQITTQGTTTGNAMTIYDNASAASGTVLFTQTGSGTAALPLGWYPCGPAGTGIPFANGLWVVSTASTGGAGVVVFSEGVPTDGRPAT